MAFPTPQQGPTTFADFQSDVSLVGTATLTINSFDFVSAW